MSYDREVRELFADILNEPESRVKLSQHIHQDGWRLVLMGEYWLDDEEAAIVMGLME